MKTTIFRAIVTIVLAMAVLLPAGAKAQDGTPAATPAAAQWLGLQTPGIPRTADGKPDLTAPAPRTADGRPELTGLWRSRGVTGSAANAASREAAGCTAASSESLPGMAIGVGGRPGRV